MNASAAQTEQKRIEDLTQKEVDMIYSLARVGEWTTSDIGRRYRISEADVRNVIENYAELRKTAQGQPRDEGLRQDPAPALTKKRKRRRDARYRSAAERQAAYRARLKEKRRAGIQVPSPGPVTDSPAPVEEELSVTTVDIP